MRARLAIALALLGAPALAQPMGMGMPDPSKMSGIPRPDPSVPAGRLSIRVLRGDFAHPMIGQEVTLDGPGGARTAKVDESDHAVFDGLAIGGTYKARAVAGDQAVESQPIEMPASSGVKLMLVFAPDAAALLGEHDGVARADKSLHAGTIALSVVDGDDKPVKGIDVILAHTTAEHTDHVEEVHAKTDAQGHAIFGGLATAERDGYLVAVKGPSIDVASKPFKLDGAAGMRLGLRALHATHDPSVLAIGKQSHLIAEVKDEGVEVVENLVIENQATDPFDAGAGGLRLPLPDGAEGAQLVGEQLPPQLALDGGAVVWKGTLPPGDTPISFAYVLPAKDDAVRLRQRLPIAMGQLLLITDRFEGMTVDGDGLRKTEREMAGRAFWLVAGPPVAAGGAIDVRLGGLPHRSAWARYVAASAAALLALWGLLAAWRARSAAPSRADLDRKRGALLDELAALDAQTPPDVKRENKRARRREELVEKLEHVYRELDDAV